MPVKLREELPTVLLLGFCYGAFPVIPVYFGAGGGAWPILAIALIVTLYSSLQHEVLHGHPFRSQSWNDALVFPAIGLFVPYIRFKETHLAHHFDPNLTDPYEDPETNYIDVAVWQEMPFWTRVLARINTTLLGRMVIGPLISLSAFYWSDFLQMRRGDRRLVRAYTLHALGVLPVLVWVVVFTDLPLWKYVAGAYAGMSILKIRTFLEHQAHERAAARSVIIEDRGLLALLFLNNNYHSVHHANPRVTWHKLPALFEKRREHYLRRNEGYAYRSYASVFRAHFFKPKDGPTHPLWSKDPDLLQFEREGH